MAEPNKPTPHFPVNILLIGQVIGSQLQQGTVNSTQSGSCSTLDVKAVARLVKDLKKKLPGLALQSEDAVAAESDLATVEAQAASPRPKAETIKACLQSIRKLAEEASDCAATAGIVAAITKALGE